MADTPATAPAWHKTIAAFLDQASIWIKRIAGICLLLLVAAMIIKAVLALFGFTVSWRTPPLDQSTGIALAALVYALK